MPNVSNASKNEMIMYKGSSTSDKVKRKTRSREMVRFDGSVVSGTVLGGVEESLSLVNSPQNGEST